MSSTSVPISATPVISSETAVPSGGPNASVPHELNPVLSFLIGFAIIVGASIMNAGTSLLNEIVCHELIRVQAG